MTEPGPKSFKIYPRNLTARAQELVRGNPVTSRPESGVENCFPGLEFDQRNLDKHFFPGLLFEMHHASGIILRDFAGSGPAAGLVQPQQISEGVFLVYLQGVFASRLADVAPANRILRFTPPAGLESWRFVRDLEQGPVAVVLCDGAAFARAANGGVELDKVTEWLETRHNRAEELPGVGRFVLLFADRTHYLTENGVISPEVILPGDLTRSLCSPWQYDFADCGCFYWASNKPDLVSSDPQPNQILNFQRKDRSAEGDRAATAEDWVLKYDQRWDGQRVTMRHAEMMSRWDELPFVISGHETDKYSVIRAQAPPKRLLTRAQIIDRLKRLAPVEHALAVQYLYAYYSLGIPTVRPSPTGALSRVFTAGDEVFQVAVDEMRHLRAVNEILIQLGEPWVLGRAKIIGEDFEGDGKAFQKPFELLPLTRIQLDWFIDVEAASQNEGDQATIDGMYSLILRSIEASPDFSAMHKATLSQLIKVIVDEGIDHYKRFSRARSALAGISEKDYLKVTKPPMLLADGDADRVLQDAADASYLVVLRSLDYVFQLGDKQRGAMMEAARRAMYNMDDAARSLASRGHGALFDHSRFGAIMIRRPAAAGMAKPRPVAARTLGDPLRDVIERLQAAGHDVLATRMGDRLDTMTAEFEAAAHQANDGS